LRGFLANGHKAYVDDLLIRVAAHQRRHIVALVVIGRVCAPLPDNIELGGAAGGAGHPAARPFRDLKGGAAPRPTQRLRSARGCPFRIPATASSTCHAVSQLTGIAAPCT